MADKQLISREMFISMIGELEKYVENSNEFSDNLAKIFPNSRTADFTDIFSSDLFASVVNLLSHLMNDKYNWIEYFIYELDFGKENYRLKVYDIDKKEIPLSNASELYDYLIENN